MEFSPSMIFGEDGVIFFYKLYFMNGGTSN